MKAALVAVLGFMIHAGAVAATIKNIEFADTVEQNGKKLVLNGMGVRTKFVVEVYVAALYLENKSDNGAEIVESAQQKRLEIQFLRNVDRQTIVDTTFKALHVSCETKCKEQEERLKKFADMQSEMSKDDRMYFVFTPEGIEYYVKGALKGKIEGGDFSRTLINAYIGPNPPNEGLKKGLLGK